MRIEPTHVVLEPGGQAQVTVTVRNPGQIVEGYRLTVHGGASDWADVVMSPARDEGGPPGDADVLRVYPGQEGSATVVFTAPAGSAGAAGSVPFAVLAQSVVDDSAAAAEEGDLEIGRVEGLAASLTPVTSRGRWAGRHTVRISNWGNAPASLRLTASDPDEALAFLVSPDRLELPVGRSAVAAVRVRTRRPFLRGAPVRLPFRVVAGPGTAADGETGGVPQPAPVVSDPSRPVLDGALEQRPVLSRGTVALGALAAAALVAGTVLVLSADPAPAQEPVSVASVVPPQEPTAVALGHDRVEVRWAAFLRPPDGVLVFRIDPETTTQSPPRTIEEFAASGDENVLVIPDLPPETDVCVELAAVRGERQSPRTREVCDRTEQAPEATAAAPPASPSTAPSETEPVETAPSEPGSSGPTSSAPGSSTLADPGGTSPDGPGGGGSPAPGTPDGSGSTPSGTAPFAEDAWLVGRPVAKADRGAPVIVERRQQELGAALAQLGRDDLRVEVLDTEQHQDLGIPTPSLYVAVGPFASEEEAAALCPELGLAGRCDPRQPGAPS